MSFLYDIEERIEDAFVGYLSGVVGQSTNMQILPAFSTNVIKYPSCVVSCNEQTELTGSAQWSIPRKCGVNIAVLTEAKNILDTIGNVVFTARQANIVARSAVITALSIDPSDAGPAGLASLCDAIDAPKGLAAYLSFQQVPGIWIKNALLRSVTRSVDADRHCLVSEINVSVIAQAVELTANS